MSAKFHNTPKGPAVCRASKGGCPYGKAGGEHYPTKEIAQKAYENEMAKTFGNTKALNRSTTKRKKLDVVTSYSAESDNRLNQGANYIISMKRNIDSPKKSILNNYLKPTSTKNSKMAETLITMKKETY